MQNTNAAGIAVLVSKKNAQTLMGRYSASDRLMYVDVMCDGVVARCISVYTPHVGYPSKDFDNVYQQMRSLLGDSVRGGLKIFIGAQLGVVWPNYVIVLILTIQPMRVDQMRRFSAGHWV